MRYNDSATIWVKTGRDGFGTEVYDAPTDILVRWEDKQELIVDSAGETSISTAKIFTKTVYKKGDYIIAGTSAVSNPRDVDSRRVLKTSVIGNLKGTKQINTLWV